MSWKNGLTRPRGERVNHESYNQTDHESTNRRDGNRRRGLAEGDTADEDDGLEAFAEDGDKGEEKEDPAACAGAFVDA